MRMLFLQVEDYDPAKIHALTGSIGLQAQDQIFSPQLVISDCPDRSRVYESETLFQLILLLVRKIKPDVVLLEDNLYSRALAVKTAKGIGYGCFTNVQNMKRQTEGSYLVTTFAYQSNLTYCTEAAAPLVITMHLPETHTSAEDGFIQTEKIELPVDYPAGTVHAKKGDSNILKTANAVFVCGQGVGSKDNALKIAGLAETFHAAVGATRPVVANGWLPPECLVGISGTQIRPELCLVFGASGSQAFMAGISGSKKIISINRDPSAAIFHDSDEGIVCDCMEFSGLLNSVRNR